jgi:beta-glucosidase
MDVYLNCQFLDAALLGEVSDVLPQMFGPHWRAWGDDEARQIQQPVDFVGVNYYLRLIVAHDPSAGPARARVVPHPNSLQTAMGWEIYPDGLTEILQWAKLRYNDIPLFITENGAAFDDELLLNRTVDDPRRVQYLAEHLRAANRAIQAGVDLRGYFVWSLLDNFEWQCGYSKRFGIVYVDGDSQQRIPKSSAHYYSNVIRTNGSALCG